MTIKIYTTKTLSEDNQRISISKDAITDKIKLTFKHNTIVEFELELSSDMASALWSQMADIYRWNDEQ